MVRVVLTAVLNALDAVWRTQTVWPLLIVPLVDVKVAVHPIEYCPPATLIGVAASIPPTVIALEVTVALGSTPA